MRNERVREFLRLARRGEPMFADAELSLRPRVYAGRSGEIGCDHTFVFDIVERASGRNAGEIALRIGESAEQFYLGHVGYHVNPPFRGHAYAAKACRLAAPLLLDFGMRSAVITTDPGNLPSVRTCLALGCELESTVRVPPRVRAKLEISAEKHRFVWLPETAKADGRPHTPLFF